VHDPGRAPGRWQARPHIPTDRSGLPFGRRAVMTDIELIEKKLAFIETCVQELRTHSNPALIATDLREERFAAHTLQIAVQAALDIASHIASNDRLGEPETNRQLFDLLARAGWLSPALTDTMHRMAGFRNIVVHGYQSMDRSILADIVLHRLDDLLEFVAAIRKGPQRAGP
jgi:uncharacterized protein YutE (UPF0331/DUF86 family)